MTAIGMHAALCMHGPLPAAYGQQSCLHARLAIVAGALHDMQCPLHVRCRGAAGAQRHARQLQLKLQKAQ